MAESKLEQIRQSLGESTKDIKLNISSVLTNSTLSESDRYVVALSSAYFVKDTDLAAALLEDAGQHLTQELIEDAKASAALMAMNTVYYRFRHMIGKEIYSSMRASLRMNRIVKPLTSKGVFELCSMACSALAGCEACMKSHEKSLLNHGYREEQVHDCVRIASVVNALSVAKAIDVQASS